MRKEKSQGKKQRYKQKMAGLDCEKNNLTLYDVQGSYSC